MKKKFFTFILCFLILLSFTLNLYFLLPKKHSESISMGYYLSRDMNGLSYKLSVTDDNKVFLYGDKDNLLLEGKLEFNQKESCYLIKTDANTYQVTARDDVVFLPIVENGRIAGKLFTKVGDAPVSYGSFPVKE